MVHATGFKFQNAIEIQKQNQFTQTGIGASFLDGLIVFNGL